MRIPQLFLRKHLAEEIQEAEMQGEITLPPPRTGTKIMRARIDNNSVILIEATQLPGEELADQGLTDEYISIIELPSMQDVMDTIRNISHALVKVWHEVEPTKASVEFGVEIAASTGKVSALLVQGSGKANLKITLEWEKPSPTTPPTIP